MVKIPVWKNRCGLYFMIKKRQYLHLFDFRGFKNFILLQNLKIWRVLLHTFYSGWYMGNQPLYMGNQSLYMGNQPLRVYWTHFWIST